MSHRLDTPLAAQTGQLYIDDLYVFPGSNSTAMVMNVNSNVNGKHSGPSFHPEARYEVKVHVNGSSFEEITYRVSFGGADANGRRAFRLHALSGREARADSATGQFLVEGQTGTEARGAGVRAWAGRIGDSF